eukprot:554940_1
MQRKCLHSNCLNVHILFRRFNSATHTSPNITKLDKLNQELEESKYLSRNVSFQNVKILHRNMRSTQNISNRYDGIYKQEIEECLNSREVFNVLESISRGEKMANRTFDKYLISISMEKLMRLNDYNACKELYELMKKQNKNSKDENNENVKYVTMLMLYVCTQFVNKYDFALSLFYYEIIPNLEAYCLSDINKLYSYIINSSTINNQYISGQIIIDKVMDTIM